MLPTFAMPAADQPLSDAELDRLADFLDTEGTERMSLAALDGFFAALICGPEPVPATEYLPEVWGAEDAGFANADEARAIPALLLRHWNDITLQLDRSLDDDDSFYIPLFDLDAEGRAYGSLWAAGFLHGIDLRAEAWNALPEDPDLLAPIVRLADEFEDEPGTPLTPEEREEMLEQSVIAMADLHRFFEPQREEHARAARVASQVRREGPKIGRNDPCPCGSGRKYKACCGAAV